ncbi:TPA: hypothetical protein DEO28_04010 [Candidatus Dependentiae bacterium]|nr:MAG: CDP-diacylglycerol-glycerol-3-phosphate 3-phosphatidyltransferase [candidate division TM6 bacterium GW2011_GWE2_31_21]KKP53538.1 MAG: CDP-diacylglycerol-glycerol-3-phosphate 3-phosphatidyltransferase [candidate division TM6 bacterium GW2011_GWF2_33_332]HBS48221.1 hypothetical protein [Candidatus Dependentiae bacterium]HBZ73647.1 hypothetical protein [Candidatus Dependentiae bacterium]
MSIDSKKIITVSNLLTVLRIVLAPFISFYIIRNNWQLALILFFIAALTDMLDGFAARLFKQRTSLGTLLDPVADKILLLTTFASLIVANMSQLVIPFWFLIFLLVRELIIVIGALLVAFVSHDLKINPTIWGKLTTFFQIIFIFWYMSCFFFSWIPIKTFFLFFVFIIIFSTFSLMNYINIGIKILLQKFKS